MIYIQSNNKIPLWDFGSSVLHGCLNTGKPYKLCEDWNIPGSDATCIIGSVEWSEKWLISNGFSKPSAIDILKFKDFLDGCVNVISVGDFINSNNIWPIFIKPYSDVKAFRGTVVNNKFDAETVLQDYTGNLFTRTVWKNIHSEWRVYVNRGKVIGCCCYLGDSLVFPNYGVIQDVLEHALNILDNVSFTLDFAVDDYTTLFIEPNDGWAIGNYGLHPEDYLRFCEDRWKQMTIRSKNIDEILKFLELKQIELEATGEPEEIAFQLAITYLTREEIATWHKHNEGRTTLSKGK